MQNANKELKDGLAGSFLLWVSGKGAEIGVQFIRDLLIRSIVAPGAVLASNILGFAAGVGVWFSVTRYGFRLMTNGGQT